MDKNNSPGWQSVLKTVTDPAANAFISKCLAPEEERPTAIELLKDPFLITQKSGSGGGGSGTGSAGPAGGHSGDSGQGRLGAGSPTEGVTSTTGGVARRSTDDQQRADCEAGSVRGEDYLFQFSGKIKEGKLHFRLNMHYEGEDGEEENEDEESMRTSKTIDFVYDPEVDTPDEIAAEISSEFNLSPTDRDICAAALKEWLAEEGPDPHN